MSYAYEVLCDYRNYEDDSDSFTEGKALYKSLFDKQGCLRSTWKKAYIEWLESLCDLNELPSGEFRSCFIRDALDNSDDDLDIIKQWWGSDEEESEEESEEKSDKEKSEDAP